MAESLVLATLAARHGLGEASIIAADLHDDGRTAFVAPEAPIYPASMVKLPIAVAAAVTCAAGRLAWDTTVAVDAANLTANDAPSPLVPGYRATIEELVGLMLAFSDNVATNVLLDVLDRTTIAATCAPFGMRGTAVRRKLSGSLPLIDDPAATGRNAHPAGDAARLLRALGCDAVPGGATVLEALAMQHWNDKLSRGFEPADRFAHKTGETDEVSHDGGILTVPDGRRFVVVVYTRLPASAAADARFAAFARDLRALLDRGGVTALANP